MMMEPSNLRGLGAVQDSSNCWVIPDWCSWVPFSSFMSSCYAPTPAQLDDPACNAGKNLNVQANANVPSATLQACQADPANCAEYNVAASSPILAATVGTGTAGQVFQWAGVGGPPAIPCVKSIVPTVCDSTVYLLGILAITGGVLLATRK